MNILFLCTGNSCRSILAEATFNHLAPAGWSAQSAGSRPTGAVHPRSLALLTREGIATTGLHSKSWDALPTKPDVVITVCGSAAGESCPAYLGPVLRAHWGEHIPAIILTGDTSPQRLRDAQSTAALLLHKPVSSSQLMLAMVELAPQPQAPMPASAAAAP